jgi:hypothetical protein
MIGWLWTFGHRLRSRRQRVQQQSEAGKHSDRSQDGAAECESGARRVMTTKGNVNVARLNGGIIKATPMIPEMIFKPNLPYREVTVRNLARNRAWRV